MVLSFDRIMLLTQGRKLWFPLALPERKTGCWRKERMATAAWAVVQPGSYGARLAQHTLLPATPSAALALESQVFLQGQS